MKINEKVKDKGMGEIYQSMTLQMALLQRTGKDAFDKVTPFVKCRDFLVDVFTFADKKQGFQIYGMSYNPKDFIPTKDEICLYLRFPSEKAKSSFEAQISHLQELEKQNKLTPTTFTSLEGLLGVVEGDSGWLQNCMLFSLYSFVLRCLCYDLKGAKDWIEGMKTLHKKSTDTAYLNSIDAKSMAKVLKDFSSIHTKTFCGFDPTKTDIGQIHHNSGFISVFGTHTELSIQTVRNNAHWKEMSERGFTLYTKAA